jgi:hypothetical protein
MNSLEEAGAGKMTQAASIIAVGLVCRQRLQCLIGLSALDADDRQSQLAQTVIEHRRHPAGLEHDPSQAGAWVSAVAISAGVDGTFTSYTTAPSRFMTHTCVSAIETSSPAKYSMYGLLFR